MASAPNPYPEALQQTAREIKARVLSGEEIPLETVLAFLSDSGKILEKQRKAEVKKPTDVDFF